jgi:hypothetical protein
VVVVVVGLLQGSICRGSERHGHRGVSLWRGHAVLVRHCCVFVCVESRRWKTSWLLPKV